MPPTFVLSPVVGVMLAAAALLLVYLVYSSMTADSIGRGDSRRRFPALRAGASILRGIAVAGGLVNLVFAGVAGMDALDGHLSSLLVAALWTGGATLSLIGGLMLPEFIELLIAIEENTHARRVAADDARR